MSSRRAGGTGVAALGTLIAILSLAWTGPGPEPASADEAEADCRFAIRASNNLSFDVWVLLYDSSVVRPNAGGPFKLFTPVEQLKIQNQRIKRGGRMDRRYTASGRCSANRVWYIKIRRGDAGKVPVKTLRLETSGSGSTSRIVDLGPSSKWDPID